MPNLSRSRHSLWRATLASVTRRWLTTWNTAFVPVCLAIQHAHQKGIIHRDIKPSNVMVTLYDGKPVPKVIDFGVAKAIEQKLTERTLFTQYGSMVGTPQYMSPEQAEMSGLGADTRSDIYSLGVLLYELLTGSTPLTHKRIQDAAYDEVLRMIKEEEPPKPSIRLSDSGEALASISAQRRMEPAKLTKLVRGELDWMAEKERADEEAGIARAVNDFLQIDLLGEAAPDKNARGNKVTVEELLGRAAARIEGKFDQQPRIEAEIRQTIGDTYRALGEHAAAQPHLERAWELHRRVLGEEHPNTLTSMNKVASLLVARYVASLIKWMVARLNQ